MTGQTPAGIASGGASQPTVRPATAYSLTKPYCLACASTSHSITVRPQKHIAVAAARR